MDMGRVSDNEKFMEMHEKFNNLAINLNEIGQLNSLNSLTEVNMTSLHTQTTGCVERSLAAPLLDSNNCPIFL